MTDLLTAEEVATMLKVKVTTVRRWYRQGLLPGAKVGKALRFRRNDVEDWLAAHFRPGSQLRLWRRQ